MKYLIYISALILLVPTLVLSGHAQRGARTAPRTLDQLSQEAELIVRGSVVSARVEPHPQFKNLQTVVVTLNVDSTLKGSAKKKLEFRQYIWDMRDRLDAAQYAKGAELLLMLGPVSQYGLRSPVGLEQGRFRIVHDAAGNRTAVNGTGNLGLLEIAPTAAATKTMSARTSALIRKKPHGALALTDLEDAIRSFAGSTR
jgi:hypothetical protein